ncbi:hypothetical protein B0H14DRAFT_3746140 [Mycena olivaceomarginata]|nr:hypothetical protein B0H14DRAFT_3090581 [Mycena olivaceomarginata]KAJ7883885.1 hypothetical protein B0H14DRAFT_3746140 [Mycena olivaceomarginata]
MFRQLTNQLAASTKTTEVPKAMGAALRADIYTAVDQVKSWIVGGLGGGEAGDGMSSGTIMATIQKHFRDAKMGIENFGNAENEVSVVVCGVTNMIMEMSKWEGMAEAHGRLPEGLRKDNIAKGIVRAITQDTDFNLMTKEFTPKIQIISALKSVCTRIYAAGSADTRQAEAILSSRLM